MIKVRLQKAVIKDLVEKFGKFSLKQGVTKEDAETIGAFAVAEIKDLIAKGISPIEGMGKFPAYKWQTKANRKLGKDKYPFTRIGRKYGKTATPVNLKLTGNMLDALTAWAEQKSKYWLIAIGFDGKSEQSREADLKEQGHRKGVNGQPKRPIIPKRGETWAVNVQKVILEGLKYALSKNFKKLE